MQASEILDRARRLIQDETSVRWPLVELCMWLNDGQREIALQKPSASSDNRVLELLEGTYQPLPADAITLLRVVRNIRSIDGDKRTGGSTISVVARDMLDAQMTDWHDSRAVRFRKDVRHVVFDEEDTRSFYVYPGNDGNGLIEAVICVEPAPIVAQGDDPEELDAYAVATSLPAIYANALLDYVCYRAYAKDAQYVGNTNRAALHYQQFANSIGIKLNAEALNSPNLSAGIRATGTGAS
ncbi:MAG: DUF6682 family protein [Pseudomonadota bacterium]|nr:DUF6682 family protein [Pseudomonadota bacterium]